MRLQLLLQISMMTAKKAKGQTCKSKGDEERNIFRKEKNAYFLCVEWHVGFSSGACGKHCPQS